MEKIGSVLRSGVRYRNISGDSPYVVYEVRKDSWSNLSLGDEGTPGDKRKRFGRELPMRHKTRPR